MNPINALQRAIQSTTTRSSGQVVKLSQTAIEIATPDGTIIHPTTPTQTNTYRLGDTVTLTNGIPTIHHQAITAPKTYWL